MAYEKIGSSLGRLGCFEGFGQDYGPTLEQLGVKSDVGLTELAAPSALPGVLTGIGQILGEVGKVGALFYQAQQQAQIREAMLKAQLRFPPPASVFIPQAPPPKSNPPLILGVLVLVMVGGIFMYMQSQKDEGYDYAPEPQPYYELAPPRRVRRRR